MEDRKHYWEDVCIPRNEFIKEHVHLIKLLNDGNRAQLLEEAKSQGGELQRILDEAESQGLRGGGFFDWIRKKLGLASNSGKSSARVSTISQTQGVNPFAFAKGLGAPIFVDDPPKKPSRGPKPRTRIRIPMFEFDVSRFTPPPKPEFYVRQPYEDYIRYGEKSGKIKKVNRATGFLRKSQWERLENEKQERRLQEIIDWNAKYGPDAPPIYPPSAYIPQPKERTYYLIPGTGTSISRARYVLEQTRDPLGPKVFGKPIYPEHPERQKYFDEYEELPAKFYKYKDDYRYHVGENDEPLDEEGYPLEAGSRKKRRKTGKKKRSAKYNTC